MDHKIYPLDHDVLLGPILKYLNEIYTLVQFLRPILLLCYHICLRLESGVSPWDFWDKITY
jgi:hypothetical protein